MRMGELYGLKWSDIQWSAGVVHVQRQKQYVPGEGCSFTEPKRNRVVERLNWVKGH